MKMSGPEQASHVFILGKNWKLSLAELVSFMEARKCELELTDLSKSFLVAAHEEVLSPSLINDLGGTIKIGRVRSTIPFETVKAAFLRRKKEARMDIEAILSADRVVDEVFELPSKKCVFGVSLYFGDSRFARFSKETQRFFGSYFKKELTFHGSRAKFMGFPKSRQFPQLTHVEVLKKGLIEKSAEILVCIGREKTFISNTVAVHNPFEFQKRDVGRPVQRRIFSMPPRLAKIMVNLSSCLSGKVLLDPFCGVGTVLQEAMLAKASVVGMDIDPWCVKAANTNLEWLKKEYDLTGARHRVLLGDARHLTDQLCAESVDCIVTEPDLGPALHHFPTESYARKIVDRVKPLCFDFLEQAYKALKTGGTLVFVTPHVKTRTGSFVRLNINERCSAIGFQTVYPFEKVSTDNALLTEDLAGTSFLVDMEERHKIGREIHVLQK